MATPADRIEQELRRKARLGIQPTDPRNLERYNQIRAELERQTQPATTARTTQTGQTRQTGEGFLSNLVGRATGALTNLLTSAANRMAEASRVPTSVDPFYRQLESIRMQLGREAAPFQYDPEDDPQYQAALRQARANALRAAGDIAAEMNRRGLLNSTITADRANQAAQREYSYVSDTLLPQLMQQAYERYLNEQAARRQALMDQLGITERQYDIFTGERGYADTRSDILYDRERQAQQDRINLARMLTEQYGTYVEPKLDTSLVYEQVRGMTPLSMQQFQFQQAESEANRALREKEAKRDYALRSAALELQRLDNLYRQWEATGYAPEGIPGVAPGTPWVESRAPSTGTLTANQFYNAIQSQYSEPVTDEVGNIIGTRITTDPARRREMFWQVIDAGYDNATTDQILRALGFTTEEINRYANE